MFYQKNDNFLHKKLSQRTFTFISDICFNIDKILVLNESICNTESHK